MKKLLILLLIAILVVAAVVGGTFLIIKKVNDSKKVDGIYIAEKQIEDEYVVGEDIAVKVVFQSDKEFTGLVYVLDNGEEQTIAMKSGATEDKEDLNVKNGEYYASTGLLVIPATGLAAGNHLLKIYVVQDTVRTLAVDTVISFIE